MADLIIIFYSVPSINILISPTTTTFTSAAVRIPFTDKTKITFAKKIFAITISIITDIIPLTQVAGR